jgi:pimeloyl-ACP methyl ester carboxylesterase
LHGFPDAWFGWYNQIEVLAAAGYRVIIPDQRGYNLSSKPKGKSAYVIDNLVSDILELMTTLEYKKFNIMGHDWGAMVCWNIALHYPDRINKLIIINVPHPAVMGKFIKNYPPQRRKSWYIFFFQIPYLPELIVRMFNWKFLIGQMSKQLTPELIEEYRIAWSQKKAMTSMMNWYRAGTRKSKLRWKSPRINIPTLMIWGKDDRYLSVKMAKPSIQYCDNGTLKILEGTSHWVHQDKPDEVNSYILDFLKKT